jgi:transaldolase
MSANPAQKLSEFGQSIWYDNISKDLLDKGELARLIEEDGVKGLTSNPTIFEKAIGGSSLYDQDISRISADSSDPGEIFEELAVADLARAADLFLPVYEASGGSDGFVSIEVSPLLASDSEGTVKEAERLYSKLNRPNVMIKIPGTPAGLPAIREVLEKGISVNITLLFSVENYVKVAEAHIEALEARVAKGEPVDRVQSVASFFVSRVDSAIDKQLKGLVESGQAEAKELLGRFGIYNSRLAYQEYLRLYRSDRFKKLAEKGAKPQRPLWASTSTKDPSYRDVLYVEQLIGQDTVNTLPPATLAAFVDHGEPATTIELEIEEAQGFQKKLENLGIDIDGILKTLQEEGVQKFSDSFHSLNATIKKQL